MPLPRFDLPTFPINSSGWNLPFWAGAAPIVDQIQSQTADFVGSLTNNLLDGLFNTPFGGDPLSTGPSSSASPYVVPVAPGVEIRSIVTTGDVIDTKTGPAAQAGHPYKFGGIPDGIGAFDNHDGTFTVLVNHELGSSSGVEREHGSKGAYVTELVVDKDTLEVVGAQDLIDHVHLYDAASNTYLEAGTTAFNRFCSGDLAKQGAFYDPASGKGYQGLIYLNGEETADGRAFAHFVTGAQEGESYELPWLGNLAFENVVANPHSGEKTVVVATDDSTPGQVYVYVGDKQAGGSAVEQAGLANGKLYGIKVLGPADEARADGFGAPELRFDLVQLGTNGEVSDLTAAQLQTQSEAQGVTEFLRPEDGAWDTLDPSRFYFVTTDRFDEFKDNHDGSDADTVVDEVGRSRLWRLDLDDLSDPSKGGKIEMLLDGTEAQNMLDNITVNSRGQVMMQEDVGNQAHLGKIWMYDPATDKLTLIAEHDPARFGDFDNPAAAPFNQDEESSGIIDVSDILGTPGRDVYLFDVQAHYPNPDGELVEGGQLLAMQVNNAALFAANDWIV